MLVWHSPGSPANAFCAFAGVEAPPAVVQHRSIREFVFIRSELCSFLISVISVNQWSDYSVFLPFNFGDFGISGDFGNLRVPPW